MSEKMLNTRIQQKHDIEVNWSKAVNFTPKIGEVIVYDPDENHAAARVKIGDGVTNVITLPFLTDAITEARIDEICGIEPVMTLIVDEDGDAVINAGFPDDEGNLTI